MMTPFATLDGHRIAQFPCPRELRDAVADTIAGELGVNCVGGGFGDGFLVLFLDAPETELLETATQLAIDSQTLFQIEQDGNETALWIAITQEKLQEWRSIKRQGAGDE
ncbi:MAG: hypothetical protein R2932_49200 [Caldilineaceae bacterium]